MRQVAAANFDYVVRFGVTGQLPSMFELAGVGTAKLWARPTKSAWKALVPIRLSVSDTRSNLGLSGTFALCACVSAVAALVFLRRRVHPKLLLTGVLWRR